VCMCVCMCVCLAPWPKTLASARPRSEATDTSAPLDRLHWLQLVHGSILHLTMCPEDSKHQYQMQ
jgi:hypothetical protein